VVLSIILGTWIFYSRVCNCSWTGEQVMKAQVGSRGTGLLFFNLGATWGCVGNATSQLFTAGKRPSTPCTCGLLGPRTSLGGGKKSHPEIWSPDRTARFFKVRQYLVDLGLPNTWDFEIELRYTTSGRTPLDIRPAGRIDLYLTTHNTHKRQTSMPPAGVEPAISACERQQIPRHIPCGHWDSRSTT